MTNLQPTKRERKEAARAEREAAEQAAAARAARRRRLSVLGGVVGAAAVLVVVIVLATSGGDDKPTSAGAGAGGAVAGVADSRALLDGVPQAGKTLGKADAPVTILEFADLQCPYCRDFSLQTLPRIVQDDVRTGKAKIELHLLTFLGPDSVRGAQVAAAAEAQNRLWHFADLFYANQGEERTGYATDAFLKRIAGAAGLDAAKTFARPITTTPSAADAAADALAQRYGVRGTPSFVVGPTGGTLKLVDGFDQGAIQAAIDAAAKAKAGT